jgi:two-component system LytT family response regulator
VAEIRALIVDDEPLARRGIRQLLAEHADFVVVGECRDGREAVRALATLEPDVVFLDVQMPGLDGFDVIGQIGANRMPGVVFVTAYDAYALRAFEVHALDYVLKPFDDTRFADVLAHARARLAEAQDGATGRALAALLRDDPARGAAGYARRVLVEDDERLRFLPVETIDYLEADGNYVRIHAGAEAHRIRATLAGLVDRLDPRQFIRIHRSTVVNVNRIREVQPWFGGDYVALLGDGRKLKVSRRYRDGLLRTTL